MGNFAIIVPEDSINYISNPSFEIDTAGWSNYAPGGATGTRSRTLSNSIPLPTYSGLYDYQIVKSAGTGDFGIQWTAASSVYSNFLTGEFATFSFFIGAVSGTVTATINYNDGTAKAATNTFTTVGRHSVTTNAFTGNLTSLNVVLSVATAADFFHVDAVQLENTAYATTYFDGDSRDCFWVGQAHSSRSYRNGSRAIGGREYDLDTLSWTVTAAPGLGMANITLDTQQQANLPGELLNDFRVDSRIVQLESVIKGTSLANLHAVRNTIIQSIRPDKGDAPRPFQLKYSGGSTPLYLDVVYDSGLEFGEYTTENVFDENPAIRLFAPDPRWYEEKLAGIAQPPSHTSAATTNYALRYGPVNGFHQYGWQTMGTAFTSVGNPVVNDIKLGPDNRVYYAGFFGAAGGVANTRGIAIWNAETEAWESWDGDIDGPGGFGIDLCWDATGNAYCGGNYTAMQGVANTANLAKWTKSTTSWGSITPAGSANGEVRSCIVDQTGNLYVSGNFTTINAVSATRIAKYDGTTWTALGTGLNGLAYDMAISPAGDLYVAGSFTTANGVTVNRIAKWNGTTFEALEGGASSGIIYVIHFGVDGRLYAGGSFTAIGSVTTNGIARWNGQRWDEVGGGFNSGAVVYDITGNENGDIVASGDFSGLADTSKTFSSPIALWNGSSWSHLDVHVPGSGASLIIHSNLWIDTRRKYLGFQAAGAVTAANAASASQYSGTAKTYPTVIIDNTTTETPIVKWIENQTTNAVLYLNHTLLPGERLTITLQPGQRSIISSFRGLVWESIEPASAIEDFTFEPNVENIVALFIDGYTTLQTTQYFVWKNYYWSADV